MIYNKDISVKGHIVGLINEYYKEVFNLDNVFSEEDIELGDTITPIEQEETKGTWSTYGDIYNEIPLPDSKISITINKEGFTGYIPSEVSYRRINFYGLFRLLQYKDSFLDGTTTMNFFTNDDLDVESGSGKVEELKDKLSDIFKINKEWFTIELERDTDNGKLYHIVKAKDNHLLIKGGFKIRFQQYYNEATEI